METTLERSEQCIKTCNRLLRGELSAIETYTKAIDKFHGENDINMLTGIRDEHEKTVTELRQNIIDMCGTPDSEAGLWGDFATGVQAAANLFGEDSAVASLIQGEKHGIREYQDAIEDDDTMPNCREQMLETWLPRLRSHVEILERDS